MSKAIFACSSVKLTHWPHLVLMTSQLATRLGLSISIGLHQSLLFFWTSKKWYCAVYQCKVYIFVWPDHTIKSLRKLSWIWKKPRNPKNLMPVLMVTSSTYNPLPMDDVSCIRRRTEQFCINCPTHDFSCFKVNIGKRWHRMSTMWLNITTKHLTKSAIAIASTVFVVLERQ